MKKFEVPFNFADDYFPLLEKCKEYFDYIKFIYLPAFKENGIENTRETGGILNNPNYINYDKYIHCINKIKELGLDVCILIQKNATLDIVKKYINEFNIKYFIINDDILAKELKKIYGDKIYLILSITRELTFDEIKTNDYSMYDEIVLYFWFNKRLNVIKELPKKYKYCILANSHCSSECPYKKSQLHWFENNSFQCKRNHIIYIHPENLCYFDKYIHTFKLVDRTFSSEIILSIFMEYIDAYKNINTYSSNMCKSIEDFYNIGLELDKNK